MMAIINKSFALTLIIPEAILRWIGAQLTGGGDMTGETKQELIAAVGVVKGAGTQAMGPGQRNKPRGGDETPSADADKPGGDKPGGGGKDGAAPERADVKNHSDG